MKYNPIFVLKNWKDTQQMLTVIILDYKTMGNFFNLC